MFYCERDYSILCSECSLNNYGHDCFNNSIIPEHGISLERLEHQIINDRLSLDSPEFEAISLFLQDLEEKETAAFSVLRESVFQVNRCRDLRTLTKNILTQHD